MEKEKKVKEKEKKRVVCIDIAFQSTSQGPKCKKGSKRIDIQISRNLFQLGATRSHTQRSLPVQYSLYPASSSVSSIINYPPLSFM